MATIEGTLLQDINVLATRIAHVRASDARAGATQINALTAELGVKWDELRAARVATLGVDLVSFAPHGYHASDGRRHLARPHGAEIPALRRGRS